MSHRRDASSWIGAIGLCWLLSCAVAAGAGPFAFSDVTPQSGVQFRHNDGSSGRYFIVEYVSGGLATLDYDGDGDLDLYFLNGAKLPGVETSETPTNALYRNDGNWHFTDVTKQAGVGDTGHGLGVAAGDYDNDGDTDLYLNNCGPNVLYRNNGDGTFTDVTNEAGVGNGVRVGAGTSFLDYDRDGDLDLYVANYVKFSFDRPVTRTTGGRSVYPGPRDYEPDPDTLYRNNGDGTFTDVSQESGIARHAGPGMGIVCADYDRDGDTDVFVGNDSFANFLFRNDGTGKFSEVGLLSGFACDLDGKVQGTMGVDCGDYDNDGWLDIHATSYQAERCSLYRNLGKGQFEDVSVRSGAAAGSIAQVKWGNALVDFDNDGRLDLFIACGHLHDNVEQFDKSAQYEARNVMLWNQGEGRFQQVSNWDENCPVAKSSRGLACDDLDNDGDIDLVVLNSRNEATLLRNELPHSSRWVQLQLRGTQSNRDAVGARVELTCHGIRQTAEVLSGRGYQSHFGSRLHFGLGQLGATERIERVRIIWPSGTTQELTDLKANQLIEVKEP